MTKSRKKFDAAFKAKTALECHSACNIDPLSRGIGVQN